MPPALLLMSLIVAITLAGDYFLKLAALRHGLASYAFAGGVVLYIVSAVVIVIAMRHMTLASFGVYYAVLTILAMAAMGTFVFGEKLIAREVLGIGFAFAALACMTRIA